MVAEKEDIKQLLAELKDLMDGPGPDVEDEIMKNPSSTAVCEYCREPVVKSSNSVLTPKLFIIGESKKTE